MIPVYVLNHDKSVHVMWSIESQGNYNCPKCGRRAERLGDGLPEHYCIDCDKHPEFYNEKGGLRCMEGIKIG